MMNLIICIPTLTRPIFSTGSGFKSVKPFRSGYFGASIKLQPGYTAGVITAFYVRTINSTATPIFLFTVVILLAV